MEPYPFHALLIFGFLSIFLLLGMALRATVPFFQRFLFPASLIGGLGALIIMNTGFIKLEREMIESFAYHFFNISFISVGLTSMPREKSTGPVMYGSLWMALVQGINFPLQALAGSLVVFVAGWLGVELFTTFGFLLPLGFNEGPGQALSIGKVWEGAGFSKAATIGLSLATIGYFFSFFVGVPLANRFVRRMREGDPSAALPVDFTRGFYSRLTRPRLDSVQTTHPSSLETLAFHAGLVGLVYVLTWLFTRSVSSLMAPDSGRILWGFFFLFGLVIAIIIRRILEGAKLEYLMDAASQRRITGFSVDYLIVATGAGIELLVVWDMILPISVAALLGGTLTTLIVVSLGKELGNNRPERTMAIYGVVTGTVSCGLLLLRIVDPEFTSPASREIGIMNVFAVPIIGGLTVLLNAPLWWGWSLLMTCGVLAMISLTCFLLLRVVLYRMRSKDY